MEGGDEVGGVEIPREAVPSHLFRRPCARTASIPLHPSCTAPQPEPEPLTQRSTQTIYYGAVESSIESAEVDGPYETYEGSPASKGQLQYDLWNVTPSDRWDW